LTKEYTKWVLIANFIALPIAWYLMNRWLQNFAYRISIDWTTFLLSGMIAFVIAFLTVSIQSIRTATKNPVSSLRYE
jgi:putative ABC transport system permease protein